MDEWRVISLNMGNESNDHKNIRDPEIHDCKGFSDANVNDAIVKSEKGETIWEQRLLMPAALNININSLSAPPTTADGDIYVLNKQGSSLDVNTITWQSGTTVRYAFNGSPDLSIYSVGWYMKAVSASQAVNNGSFVISAINNTSKYIDVTNELRTDAVADEASDSTAVATITHSSWSGAAQNDWVRYDLATTKWYAINAIDGMMCLNKSNSTYYGYASSSWVSFSSIAKTIDESIVAFAGGGQVSATALASNYNTVITCASDYDSAKLPSAVYDLERVVYNNTSSILSVYPQSGESINGITNYQFNIAPGGTMIFRGYSTGKWLAFGLSI